MEKLAIHGGTPNFSQIPKPFNWFSDLNLSSVTELIKSQQLSGFLAQSGSSYLGGIKVRELETKYAQMLDANFAVSFNSWTSGLEAIFLSLDFEVGSEVVVSPWTMSASVAAIVLAGFNPVFCDIDIDSFNIDPVQIRKLVTPRTKAICVVDIFGRPADWIEIKKIADEFDLLLIADSAQTPSALIDGKHPVNIADLGGFSFNRHKHLQTGEGGIVITDDPVYCDRLRAFRNHGEVSSSNLTMNNRTIIGHNWRLGEIEALIATLQLDRFETLISHRRFAAEKLIEGLQNLPGIFIPGLPQSSTHDYYILGMHFDTNVAGFSRDYLIQALRAEGLDFVIGEYCQLHRLPAYSKYRAGDLLVTDKLNREQFLGLYLCGYDFTDLLIVETIETFKKIWKYARRT